MKVGIMQPYFFPYIGYWQLMNAVDQYVIYDDVNYIKGGWINRNRILTNGTPKYINVPMLGASPNKLINEIAVNTDIKLVDKNLRTIENSYKKSPYFEIAFPIIENILTCSKTNLAEYLEHSIYEIATYLSINTKFQVSSKIKKDSSLKGEDKILEICNILDASEYYNAIGGKELYNFKHFNNHNIELKFLETNEIKYSQFTEEFHANLSIIDIMMFNSRDAIIEMLNNYSLITE